MAIIDSLEGQGIGCDDKQAEVTVTWDETTINTLADLPTPLVRTAPRSCTN